MSELSYTDKLIAHMEPQTIIGSLLDESRKRERSGHYATAMSLVRQAELFVPFVSGEHRQDYERFIQGQRDDIEASKAIS